MTIVPGLKGPSLAILLVVAVITTATGAPAVLNPDDFKRYVEGFNRADEELTTNAIPNSDCWHWMNANIPWFECSDPDIETIYYFRWWTYRKHLKLTPDGFVVTEFLAPVPWAGKYNTISCAAGHHIYEGRWLHDPSYLDDYITFWLRGGGDARLYSNWIADAVYQRFRVSGDKAFVMNLLGGLAANYRAWEKDHFDAATGLFWQSDDRDGMEVSIGGSGYRPTINSYMYGGAMAIMHIAELARDEVTRSEFEKKASRLRERVQSALWDGEAQFFKVLPKGRGARLADVRELHGFTPWYFDLPAGSFDAAWKQLADSNGFYAPFGPTTAEQRHPKFAVSYRDHECQWNGPSWPYATSVTLTALANLLNGEPQHVIGKREYFELLKIYAKSHHRRREDGGIIPWIDENLNPFTGDWLSRTRLKVWNNGSWSREKGGVERGKDYNHSTFNDLVITGLAGFRPSGSRWTFEVNPLIPEDGLDYFCLDDLGYQGVRLAIIWDRTGDRYHRGAGLHVLENGREIASSKTINRLKIHRYSPF